MLETRNGLGLRFLSQYKNPGSGPSLRCFLGLTHGHGVSGFGFPSRFGLSGGWFGPRGRWLRRPSGVLPRRVGSQLTSGAWFITEVRSLQDLRQEEDRYKVKGAEEEEKEEDASALEDAETPAAHLKRRPE